MNFTRSSPKRIEKVSSDNSVIGFDLLSSLTYMSVLVIGGVSRDQMLSFCARQPFKTAVIFEHIYLLAKFIGIEYTNAFQLISEKVRASRIKSLLLRFAASISSGESEREFIVQETNAERERYVNEYNRNVENLRKWTDAYAAILVSVTLVMVVSLVSAMMGNLGQNFIVAMAFVLFAITAIGVYVIYKVAPTEQMTYDAAQVLTRQARRARLLFFTLAPVGLVLALLIAPRFGFMAGSAVAFLCLGISLLPAGAFAWLNDVNVNRRDSELPTFLRTLGNVAGASGLNITEALGRIDTRSMGSLEPPIVRLRTRLQARLPRDECWEAFREETGSELVNRSTRMLVEGSEYGGRADQVGQICSNYTLEVVQLRAKRHLTASTFSFLTVPLHATMVFVLVFVLQIVTIFNEKLAEASVISSEDYALLEGAGFGTDPNANTIFVPENLELPAGIHIPQPGELSGGLGMFGNQDLTLVSYVIVVVVIVLTLANAIAPKFAAGGNNLKVLCFLSPLCIVSGAILGAVPIVANYIFSVS